MYTVLYCLQRAITPGIAFDLREPIWERQADIANMIVPELVIRKDADIDLRPDFLTLKPKLAEVPRIVQVHETDRGLRPCI